MNYRTITSLALTGMMSGCAVEGGPSSVQTRFDQGTISQTPNATGCVPGSVHYSYDPTAYRSLFVAVCPTGFPLIVASPTCDLLSNNAARTPVGSTGHVTGRVEVFNDASHPDLASYGIPQGAVLCTVYSDLAPTRWNPNPAPVGVEITATCCPAISH